MTDIHCPNCGSDNFNWSSGIVVSCVDCGDDFEAFDDYSESNQIELEGIEFIREIREALDSDIPDAEFEEYFGRSKETARAFLYEQGHQ